MTAGRAVLVAGGGRGIGAAVAHTLAEAGDQVVVADAFGQTHAGYALADDHDRELFVQGYHIDARTVDLRDFAATQRLIDELAADHGPLDVVICCASVIAGGRRLWDDDERLFEELWRSNALTVRNVARATMPTLLKRPAQRTPTFVAVTSVADHIGLYGLHAYVSAKHAAAGVVRALAADLVGTAVTACAVVPGATDTAMLARTAELYGLSDVSELSACQQGGKPLAPQDVADVIVFASRAGRAVHGAMIAADGGFG